jgi:hypothetical protein
MAITGNVVATSLDTNNTGVLAFSFIGLDGSYDILRDGRHIVTSVSDVLFVNGVTTTFGLLEDRKYVVVLDRSNDTTVDVYVDREGALQFSGTITSAVSLDTTFQTNANVIFGTIVSCDRASEIPALQLCHRSYPRTVNVTGYTISGATLLANSTSYSSFGPECSLEIRKALGVESIVSGSGGKVVKDRYTNPCLRFKNGQPKHARPGDLVRRRNRTTSPQIRAHDHILGQYRTVQGSFVLEHL